MNKKIKVIELLNLLAENKIKKGTRIKFYSATYKIEYPNLRGIYRENEEISIKSNLFTSLDIYQLNREIEILEDEDEEEKDIETKLFEEIEMCLKRLSDKDLVAKPYVDRYEFALKEYKAKKINKED